MNLVPIVSMVTFLPLLGAIAVALIPGSRVRAIRLTTLGFTVATLIVSLYLLLAYDTGKPGFQMVETLAWIPFYGIQYKLGVDGISIALVLLTTLLSAICVVASFRTITERVKSFMLAFLVLEIGMTGAFVALDMFLFFIFFELVLVPMYLIIGIWGGPNRVYATLKFVLYTLVGSLLMLVAILATAYAYANAHGGSWTGAFDLVALQEYAATAGFARDVQTLAFLGLFFAFAIKVPMFPFHTWLPDAHVEAPTVGSVILAGVLLKLGGYGFIRFALPLCPDAARQFAPVIVALSIIAIIYGALVALVQTDLKKLIAYSSVSHMGFVTLGIFVFKEAGLEGAIVQMVAHGLITSALFLCVGIIYDRTHDRMIANLGGLTKVMPKTVAAMGFFVFASLGLPGLAGFVGEFLVFLGTFAYNPFVAIAAQLVMVLAAAYLLFMYQRIAFTDLSDLLRKAGPKIRDLHPIELATLLPLGTLVIVFGVFPGLLLNLIHGPVAQILASPATSAAASLVAR